MDLMNISKEDFINKLYQEQITDIIVLLSKNPALFTNFNKEEQTEFFNQLYFVGKDNGYYYISYNIFFLSQIYPFVINKKELLYMIDQIIINDKFIDVEVMCMETKKKNPEFIKYILNNKDFFVNTKDPKPIRTFMIDAFLFLKTFINIFSEKDLNEYMDLLLIYEEFDKEILNEIYKLLQKKLNKQQLNSFYFLMNLKNR